MDSTERVPSLHLREHLAPDAYARLRAEGLLPVDLLQEECARLRAELAAIASYIPSIIVRRSIAQPGRWDVTGAYWSGSVLFADLSGFTALSERLSVLGKQGAEEISAIINRLFGVLVEEIHRYQGSLLKFGGDALTAFFDAAVLGERHAILASHAALAMQQRMQAFAALETRGGTFPLRLRIGVHSGKVFAAEVGDREHIELVITGHNINRVALAQEIAEPGEVVVSTATLELLPAIMAHERQTGFHLITHLPDVTLLDPGRPPVWQAGRADLEELLALVERIATLQPYLPRGLPQRFLRSSGGQEGGELGEFRPVTVLFANFFPFSALLDMLGDDSVTAARALNAYYQRAQQVVHHYGGIVNKVDMYTHGDKLMALFGAPVAHEDDPQRAARAALDLRVALAQANAELAMLLSNGSSPFAFGQRIGLNTGVVFAGRVGSAARHEYTVMGQHVNLSARLMGAAEVGAVVLSPTTRRAVERHIALRELSPVKLKGVAEPVALAEALRPLEVAQDVRRSLARPPLVGRASELERLIDEGRSALAGSGRVVALAGEAGAGKTRLIEETLQRLVLLSGDQEVPVFFTYTVECQSYDQNTPYAVIRDLLRQVFHLAGARDGADRQAAAIQRSVEQLAPDLARFTPLLADLTGIPFEETALTSALTVEQRHDRAQELVEELLLAEARKQPLLVIVDDLHWADASSLELLTRLIQHAPFVPLLMLLGYRIDPPIPEPWSALAHCTHLTIGELLPQDSMSLVQALLGDRSPPELHALIDQAQGNPFFVEEVVRALVESGTLIRGPDGWQLTRALEEAAIPDSIEGVITARLDRLEDRSREVLQVAAVIGRRFPYPVLSGVVARRDDLRDRLGRLADADLILTEDEHGVLELSLPAYLFKHALTAEVAYEAILYARRRELHRRVARQIEQLSDRLDEQLAVLARHYALAEEWPLAFDYYLRAARQAQARYANREAITLFERALDIAARQESGRDQPAAEDRLPVISTLAVAEISERLGVVHALIGEYNTALDRYLAALELLRRQPARPIDELVRLHHHIARVYEKRAEFDTAFAWVERAFGLAAEVQSVQLVRCLLLGAGLRLRQGRYNQSLDWGQQALDMATRLDSPRDEAHALKLLGGTYRNLGDNARAFELLERCLALYEQVQDLDGLSNAHNDLANAYFDLGRLAEARAHFEAGARIKEEIGDVYGQGMIACNLGELFRLQNRLDDAIAQYRRGLAIYERIGSPYMTGVLHMNLGAAHVLKNQLDRAEEHLRHSTELFHQAGAEDFLPELERHVAELHLRRGLLAEARLACELSLAIAARLEARSEEGATRRVLGQILALDQDLAGAWDELQRSLAILREAASPHEIAQTLVAIAALAPQLGRLPEGQAALNEALPALHEIGAQHDLEELQAIAAHYGSML